MYTPRPVLTDLSQTNANFRTGRRLIQLFNITWPKILHNTLDMIQMCNFGKEHSHSNKN